MFYHHVVSNSYDFLCVWDILNFGTVFCEIANEQNFAINKISERTKSAIKARETD